MAQIKGYVKSDKHMIEQSSGADIIANTKMPYDINIVEKNIGLSHFLKKVYMGTGIGFGGALATSLFYMLNTIDV